MVTVFDRFVWLRNEFAPTKSLTKFAKDSGVSPATINTAYRRWRERGADPKKVPGKAETWITVAAKWGVDAGWLQAGTGVPRPGRSVAIGELEGLSREFDGSSGSGSYPATHPPVPPWVPPQTVLGKEVPEQVRIDAATFFFANPRPDGTPFSREECAAAFRNLRLKEHDDANDARVVARSLRATILDEGEEPLVPPKPRRARSGA